MLLSVNWSIMSVTSVINVHPALAAFRIRCSKSLKFGN